MPQVYGNGSNSTIGPQLRTDFYQKKALIEAVKESYFGQLADTTNMPKHFGKTIKCFHYLPLLDDANINDQGIDAAGVSTTLKITFKFLPPGVEEATNGMNGRYVVAEGANSGAAIAAAKVASMVYFRELGYDTSNASYDTYAEMRAVLIGLGWTISDDTSSPAATAVPNSGNLYGSSKDVGTISGKLPALSETGGRVNRVGFKRVSLEGTLEKFGFFDEYTQESLDFDTDEELEMHVNREMVRGANEITEDALQIDLLNSAGILRFGGTAISTAQMHGNTGGGVSLITYEDLMRMAIDLDNNRCPKHTKIITGSRMIDTKTVNATRYLFIGSELIPMIRKMTDLFSDQAFISVEKYANSGDVAVGEIGSIDNFRVIVVPEMMHWAGVGATVTTNAGYRSSDVNGTEKYDVYPMLCVGDGSFTTVGFQTDGKTVKFTITHKKPGVETADRNDPYGETGFMSIKWYYGFMLLRAERIALAKSVAEW